MLNYYHNLECEGIAATPRQAAVVDFIRKNRVDVIGLLETKFKPDNFGFFIKNNFLDWKFVNNFDIVPSGGMLLLWNSMQVDVTPISMEAQAIHETIRCNRSLDLFHFCLIYGVYSVMSRMPLWDSLITNLEQGTPPLVSGDFNYVLSSGDRVGKRPPTKYEVKDFVDTCALLGLEDTTSSGCKFIFTLPSLIGCW